MQIRVAVVNDPKSINPCAFDHSKPCPFLGPEAELSTYVIRNLLDLPNRAEIDIKFVPATGYRGSEPTAVENLLKSNMADTGPPSMMLIPQRADVFPHIGALYQTGTSIIYKTVMAQPPNLGMFALVHFEIWITVLIFGIAFQCVKFLGKNFPALPMSVQKECVNFDQLW